MAGENDPRTYSVGEAMAYAQEKVKYCDRIAAEYPDADMGALRARAAAFLRILEDQPRSLDLLRDLLDDLRQGKDRDGSGWSLLMSYVSEYLERLENVHPG